MKNANRLNNGIPAIGSRAKKKAARNSAFLAAHGISLGEWRRMTRAQRREAVRPGACRMAVRA